jgi:hypothetical protein
VAAKLVASRAVPSSTVSYCPLGWSGTQSSATEVNILTTVPAADDQ